MSAEDALCLLFAGDAETAAVARGNGSSVGALSRELARLQDAVDALTRGSEYAVALAEGVNALVAWCWDAFGQVEAEVAADSGLSASHVHARLAPVCQVALEVADAVAPVAGDAGAATAAACDALAPLLLSGVPAVRRWGAYLLCRVRTTLCHHLQAWVAWGELPATATFFVRRTQHTAASGRVALHPSGGGSSSEVVVHVPAATAWEGGGDDAHPAVRSGAGEPASPLAATVAALQRSVWEEEWRRGYAVEEAAVPRCYLTPALADTVCMLGKVVLLLQRHTGHAGDEEEARQE